MDNLKQELNKIHRDVTSRFTYITDLKKHGLREHWPSPEQLPTDDKFTGDCDDFALMCRKLCRERNFKSRLVFCKVRELNAYHLVCEVEGYILDNMCGFVVDIHQLDYEWMYISGYEPGDKWHFTTIVETS